MIEAFDTLILFQLMTAVLSCFFLLKERTQLLRLLAFFFTITFLVEYIGSYLLIIGESNFYIYIFYVFFQFVFIFLIYKRLIKDNKSLILPKLMLCIFLLIWSLALFNKKFFYYSIIAGAINVAILIFLYLRELLLSNNIISYKNLLPFWLSVGLLVFHLPSIPFFGLMSYMKGRGLFPILTSLAVLMNLVISFGLIWSNKRVEY